LGEETGKLPIFHQFLNKKLWFEKVENIRLLLLFFI